MSQYSNATYKIPTSTVGKNTLPASIKISWKMFRDFSIYFHIRLYMYSHNKPWYIYMRLDEAMVMV